MERLYHIASVVRNKLFCSSPSRRACNMDPMVQSAWVATLPDERPALEEIDADIWLLEQHLQSAVEKEQFIGVRIRAYQKQLHKQKNAVLSEQQNEAETVENELEEPFDEEADLDANDAEKGLITNSKQEEDDKDNIPMEAETDDVEKKKHEAALESVRAIHFDLLVQCEEMRRQLHTLHKKRDTLRKLQQQVDAFLDRPHDEDENDDDDEEKDAIELPATRITRAGTDEPEYCDTNALVAPPSSSSGDLDSLPQNAAPVVEP